MMRNVMVWILFFVMVTGQFTLFIYDVKGVDVVHDTDGQFNNGILENITIVGSGKSARIEIKRDIMWSYAYPKNEIPGTYGMSAVYIPEISSVFVLRYGVTYLYNVSNNTWTTLYSSTSPPSLSYYAMCYNSAAKKVVVFGGYASSGYSSETWIFNVSSMNWQKMNPPTSPSGRIYFSMVYDKENDVCIIYGGLRGAYLSDTWVYNITTNTWTMMSPATNPGGLAGYQMAYDEESKRVILFGGRTASWTYSSKTWAYNYSSDSWSQLSPAYNPPGIYGGSMIYHAKLKKLMLIGGRASSGYIYDTYLFDGNKDNWSKYAVNGSYGTSSFGGLAYDNKTNVTVLCCGVLVSNPRVTYIFGNLSYRTAVYTSDVIDSKNAPTKVFWKNISWSGDFRNGSIKAQIAVNNDNSSWIFIGPYGLTDTYFTNSSGQDLPEICRGKRFLKYRLYITSHNLLGKVYVDKVKVVYDHPPNPPTLESPMKYVNTTTPSFILIPTDFDKDSLKLRIDISDDDFNTYTSYDQTKSTSGWSAQSYSSGTSASFKVPSGVLQHGNTYKWRACAYDSFLWSDYSVSWKFLVDITPPVPPDIVIDGKYTDIDFTNNTSSLSCRWSDAKDFESEILRYWVSLGTKSGEDDVVSWTDIGKLTNTTFTNLSLEHNKKYYVNVKAENYAHLNSSIVSSDGITVDTTPPTSPEVNDGGDYTPDTTTLSASWESSEDVSDIVEYAYAIGTSPDSDDVWSWTSTGKLSFMRNSNLNLEDGKTYYISVIARNGAGVWSDVGSSDGIMVDASSPLVTAVSINDDATYTNKRSVIVSIKVNDNLSGVSKIRLSNDGVVWSEWMSYNETIYWDVSEGDGVKTVYVQAMDVAGNIGPISQDTIILDTTAPEIEKFEIIEGYYLNKTTITLNVVVKDSYGISGICFAEKENVWKEYIEYRNTITYNYEGEDGIHKIYLKAKDMAGNEAEPIWIEFIIDRRPPEIKSFVLNDNKKYTSTSSVKCSLIAEDSVSVVDDILIEVNGEIIEMISYTHEFTIDVGNTEGKKNIVITVSDMAKNKIRIERSVILDMTSPIITMVKTDRMYTSIREIDIQIKAEDNISGVAEMKIDAETGEIDNWIVYDSITSCILPEGDGKKLISVCVRDSAGNIGGPVEISVYLDTSPPREISLSINGGAQVTTSKDVSLKIHAVDSISGVESFALSENGIDWTNWSPYTEETKYTFSEGDGKKTLYLKVRDRAGNEAVVSSSIILKTSDIVITIDSPKEGKKLCGKVTIEGSIESSLPVEYVEISIDGRIWEKADGKEQWMYMWDTRDSSDGTHTVRVRVKTMAGYSSPKEIVVKTENEPEPVTVEQMHGVMAGIAIATILGILALALSLFMIFRKGERKKPEEKSYEAPSTEDIREFGEDDDTLEEPSDEIPPPE